MKTKKQKRQIVRSSEALVMDVAKSSTFIADKSKVVNAPKRSWLGAVITVVCLLVLLIVGAGVAGAWWYGSAFEQASGASLAAMVKEIRASWNENPFARHERINFLLLGLDQIPGERDTSLLTDTMMLVSLKPSGTIHLISIPRDLWIDSLKTKINAVYYYGTQNQATTGSLLAATVVEDITGQPIDHVLVVHLSTVKSVIDALGGIDVNVQKGFVDDEFPREGADITSKDPLVLYETISFQAGIQHFDGTTALKYIRSRHSSDLEAGSDEARSIRQQEVVNALMAKMKTKEVWKNPAMVGALYRIWKEQLGVGISEGELVGIARQLFKVKGSIAIVPSQIPITEDDREGILVNPPMSKYKQWVYEPTDPTWRQLQDWVLQVVQ